MTSGRRVSTQTSVSTAPVTQIIVHLLYAKNPAENITKAWNKPAIVDSNFAPVPPSGELYETTLSMILSISSIMCKRKVIHKTGSA